MQASDVAAAASQPVEDVLAAGMSAVQTLQDQGEANRCTAISFVIWELLFFAASFLKAAQKPFL
jgi:hypothetical protein